MIEGRIVRGNSDRGRGGGGGRRLWTEGKNRERTWDRGLRATGSWGYGIGRGGKFVDGGRSKQMGMGENVRSADSRRKIRASSPCRAKRQPRRGGPASLTWRHLKQPRSRSGERRRSRNRPSWNDRRIWEG